MTPQAERADQPLPPPNGPLGPADAPGLAAALDALPHPWLVALDLDGTLAPIVARPELTELAHGATEALAGLVASGVPVLVVSGRSLDDLARFPWPSGVQLVGSHGLELADEAPVALDVEEAALLGRLGGLAEQLAASVPGCWVEHKPLSLVLHTRTATDRDAAATVTLQLAAEADRIDGVHQRSGHEVLELAVRRPSKAAAVARLRATSGATSVVFVGDDVTDEEVFREVAPPAVTVKVGDGPTAAAHRVAAPTDVVDLLRRIAVLAPDGGRTHGGRTTSPDVG
jgi:trehalose 6-phosphate phosphatase